MTLIRITVAIIILGIIFTLLGIFLKKKKVKILGIILFVIVIVFWIGFYIWALYDMDEEYERNFENSNNTTNTTNNIDSSIIYDKDGNIIAILDDETSANNITNKVLNGSFHKNGQIKKIINNYLFFIDSENNEYVLINNNAITYTDGRTADTYSFDEIKNDYYISFTGNNNCYVYKNIIGDELKQEILISLSLSNDINIGRANVTKIDKVEQLGNNNAIVTFTITDVIRSEYFPNINDNEHTFEMKFKVTNNTKYNTQFNGNITYNTDTIEIGNSYMLYIRLNEDTINNEYPEISLFDVYSN